LFLNFRLPQFNPDRERLNSGYVNILAHDNTKEYRDAKHQKHLLGKLNERMHQKPLCTPLTPDNNIVFINRDSIIRRPREFKTPPPPFYGEEEEYEMNPREQFYDPVRDPNVKKFDFLDSRQGSVSNHYQKFIDSKMQKKRRKRKRIGRDSIDESELEDTIGELPGMNVQTERGYQNREPATFRPTQSSIYRTFSNPPPPNNDNMSNKRFNYSRRLVVLFIFNENFVNYYQFLF
jgi:hypothetical protein